VRQIAAFIRLSRLYFLPMPVLTYLIGIALVEREDRALDRRLLWAGIAIQLLVQLSVSYLNDYWDIPTDRLNTRRTLLTGGSGELTTGLLPPWIALLAGAICQGSALLLAVITGLPPVSWVLLALAMGAAIFYTTPPLKLAWRGLGEFTTAFVGAMAVPAWAYSLQTGHLRGEILVITLPLTLFVATMFIAIAAPDFDADRRVGKRTLPVRVGEARIAALYAGILALAYLAALIVWPGRVPALVLALTTLTLPVGLWAWRGFRAPLSDNSRALLKMVLRAALIPLIVVLALNIGLRLSS
jgi:1,4-dihydroxy-2-naphthoate octaprenyltransferase